MSAPTEDRGTQLHPTLGDLKLWYPAFERYAAASPLNGADFHGAHVETPASLDRVWQALEWLERNHGAELKANPLPSLEKLNTLLTGNGAPVRPFDEGSMCHMIWHWIHGEH